MRKIELYGATHAVTVRDSLFGYKTIHAVAPPEGLLPHLATYPSVGVETTRTRLDPNSFEEWTYQDIGVDRITTNSFFDTVEVGLRNSGIEIEYLDDERYIHNIQPRLLARVVRLKQKERSIETEEYGMFGLKDERRRGFARSLLQLIDVDLRERTLFKNIASSNAAAYIIGAAHADTLAGNPDLQEQLGVRVSEYYRIGDELEQEIRRQGRVPTGAVLPSTITTPTQENIALGKRNNDTHRRLIQRQYNAYSTGRILPRNSREPDMLGRFYITGPAEESLFEIHIEDRDGDAVCGKIYDLIGDAEFTGTINSDEMNIRKVYDPSSTLEHPDVLKPIIYEGDTYDGTIQGSWGPENGERSMNGRIWGYVFRAQSYRGKNTVRNLNNLDD